MLSYVNVKTRDIALGFVTRDQMLNVGFPHRLLDAIANVSETLDCHTKGTFTAQEFMNRHILRKPRQMVSLLGVGLYDKNGMSTVGQVKFSVLDALLWVLDWYKDAGFIEVVTVLADDTVTGLPNYKLKVTQQWRDRDVTWVELDKIIADRFENTMLRALLRCQQDLDCSAGYTVTGDTSNNSFRPEHSLADAIAANPFTPDSPSSRDF